MNGKFKDIYKKQIEFQENIIKKYQSNLSDGNLPADNPILFSYHMTAMQEELGELLKADKRWKTHRNEDFDPDNKLEELSDCFVTLLNISIHSGYSADVLLDAIYSKIIENSYRMERNDSNDSNI